MSKVIKFFKSKKEQCIRLLVSFGLLLVSALIGIFLALKETNGLDRYVNDAYAYYQDNNWGALYRTAGLTDDDFINAYFFEVLESSKYGEIEAAKLKLGEVSKDGDKATVKLTYNDEGSEPITWILKLEKTSERKYIFFNKWKLDIDELILENCTVTVPTGCDAYVDGVELKAENSTKLTNEEKGTDTYTIPKIFEGTHTINVTNDIIDVINTQVVWNEDGSSYTQNIDELLLAPSEKDVVDANAKSIIQLMYTAVFTGEKTEELSAYFAQDEATKAMVQTVYDSIFAAITPDDGSTLNTMTITAFEESDIKIDGNSAINVTMTFACTYSARGPRNTGGGVREKYDGETTSTVIFHFSKEGDSWLCDDLNMQCIDYSKQSE